MTPNRVPYFSDNLKDSRPEKLDDLASEWTTFDSLRLLSIPSYKPLKFKLRNFDFLYLKLKLDLNNQ